MSLRVEAVSRLLSYFATFERLTEVNRLPFLQSRPSLYFASRRFHKNPRPHSHTWVVDIYKRKKPCRASWRPVPSLGYHYAVCRSVHIIRVGHRDPPCHWHEAVNRQESSVKCLFILATATVCRKIPHQHRVPDRWLIVTINVLK